MPCCDSCGHALWITALILIFCFACLFCSHSLRSKREWWKADWLCQAWVCQLILYVCVWTRYSLWQFQAELLNVDGEVVWMFCFGRYIEWCLFKENAFQLPRVVIVISHWHFNLSLERLAIFMNKLRIAISLQGRLNHGTDGEYCAVRISSYLSYS